MVILEVELEEMVEVHIPECHERLGPGNTLEHLAEKHGTQASSQPRFP